MTQGHIDMHMCQRYSTSLPWFLGEECYLYNLTACKTGTHREKNKKKHYDKTVVFFWRQLKDLMNKNKLRGGNEFGTVAKATLKISVTNICDLFLRFSVLGGKRVRLQNVLKNYTESLQSHDTKQ